MSLEKKIGKISLDLLFKESKSEAIYPVLHCEDGISYRLHIRGNVEKDAPLLEHLNEVTVSLMGEVDDARGHWRIVLDPNLEESISIIQNQEEESINLDQEQDPSEAKAHITLDVVSKDTP